MVTSVDSGLLTLQQSKNESIRSVLNSLENLRFLKLTDDEKRQKRFSKIARLVFYISENEKAYGEIIKFFKGNKVNNLDKLANQIQDFRIMVEEMVDNPNLDSEYRALLQRFMIVSGLWRTAAEF